ncbi:putative UDP-glucuronosyl/UDP-glucosyltransferase, UDP-glycosyltransferase family [Helianthus annuus]|uniref:Glycosyltransferase n=1 Tax=Helianthus annuus TaxID=4232 RepID=A0A251TDL4_HELAN|nr:UDP-glycosyltransferase 73E1 [Helianthus annuus]KAF5784095.1 putative UDP-glucuronosyl/UDP-glucosyltransferase, UDP-glycosyltransferase family [Helianthus annuus]KAJ0519287.1 putative UDP-glucuronosyl/UDP-glucosyltransferase, UDP-glycosyltransferase family [Helianthus annuus]KAJ0872755.1 putative UDP-glucuronosyl/UDP-glucosyltransferase, UDP-glycosyltransferase family [Helianthus annuus]KAJ0877150.1 putative UDP-glucuronosyl/UDP-glucosyltransferase, UDP-glycosyltransferase family [Helianthus
MASHTTNLHFVLFPLMAQGHMIPMVDMARILAQRGAMVTIITSPVNANRFRSVVDRAIEADLKIQILELQLPLAEVGLPEGCENFDLLPSSAHAVNMILAMNMLEEPAENMLKVLCPPPSCIISDGCFPWTNDVAKRLNIPRVVFYGPGCFAFLCVHIVTSTNILDEIDSDSEYFVMPGLPDQIEVTKPQASTWGRGDTKESTQVFERMVEAEKDALGIVVNSFEELEPKYVKELSKVKAKRVWCVGPVSLCNKSFQDRAERGNKIAINMQDCLKWLDAKESGSVIYVCLGSLSYASTEQAIELGLGLESSNIPFLWFIRQPSEEFEEWLFKEGYEERIKGKGLMVRGWAPQILILSHQAIGGFVTHCGWNSSLEGISAGIPMVTWPQFGEQFLNERFIINVLKIGVRIGMEVPVIFNKLDESKEIMKRDDIKQAIEGLMKNDEEGEARRKRCMEFAVMAKSAMEEGGSSQRNMTSMIQAIIEELAKKKTPV